MVRLWAGKWRGLPRHSPNIGACFLKVRANCYLVSSARKNLLIFVRNRQTNLHSFEHECAPIQTGSVICCTLEAVDIECRPPRAEELAKRAKKLSALSGARSC